MTRKFAELRARMSPESLQRAEGRAQVMLAKMPGIGLPPAQEMTLKKTNRRIQRPALIRNSAEKVLMAGLCTFPDFAALHPGYPSQRRQCSLAASGAS